MSFFRRAFERLENSAICLENSILKLEFGSEYQHFEGKYPYNLAENLSKHQNLSKP